MTPRHLVALAALTSMLAAPVSALADEDARGPAKIKELKANQPFWTWLAEPHGREIRVVLAKVEELRQVARNMTAYNYNGVYQPTVLSEKERALDDALGMLRYARKLDKDNREVLVALAETADQAGHTGEALSLYREYLALRVKEEEAVNVEAPLGVLYARRKEYDKAIEMLEIGLSKGWGMPGPALVYSLVEMERGNLDKAIDYLVNFSGGEGTVVQLALAVAYDRNDEETNALSVLDELRKSQAFTNSMTAPYGTDFIPFTPPHDLYYFRALVYEASGHLAEARSEWQAYVNIEPPATYREKARRHIADIDALDDTRTVGDPITGGGVGGVVSPSPFTP